MEAGEVLVAMTLFLTIGATIALRGPVGKAIAQADLVEQTARDLEDLKHRLSEVEERQGFTERMMAQRAPGRLGSPARES